MPSESARCGLNSASFFSLMLEHEMAMTLNDHVQQKRSVIALPRKLIYAYVNVMELLVKQLSTDKKAYKRQRLMTRVWKTKFSQGEEKEGDE